MEPSSKKRLPVIATVGLVFLILIIYTIYKKRSFYKELVRTAYALNQTCPSMMDHETRLDSASVVGETVFQYNYTLVNMLKDSVDYDMLQISFEPAMIDNARKNPDLAPFRENNVTLAYSFYDRNKKFMMKIMVTPDKYKGF